MTGSSVLRRLRGLLHRSPAKPLSTFRRAADGNNNGAPFEPPPAREGTPLLAAGPVTRWGEVAPEGAFILDPAGPAIVSPLSGTITGPSPRLACRLTHEDGQPIDIVIEAGTGRGKRYFRLCLGPARLADLGLLRVALPAGEAHLWAVCRNSAGKLVTSGRTDLRVDLAWPNSVERIAIVTPPLADTGGGSESSLPEGDDRQLHLAVWAHNLEEARGGAGDPKFMFGPLGRQVDVLLVPAEVPGIFPNAFTAAWFAALLDEGEVGAILVERRGNTASSRAMGDALSGLLPPEAVRLDQAGWIRLEKTADLGARIAALPTSYPSLHRAYDGFRGKLEQHGWAQVAARSFMYSVLGASRNSLLLERLAARLAWAPNPVMVDIGGGFGFLGLEMAAKGWPVAVIDYDPFKTEVVGHWLARRARSALPITFHTQSMDDIPVTGLPGDRPQVITFYHSLRLARRDRVADILGTCWQSLAPGGALVIHELVHGTPGESPDDELLFIQDDLIRIVTENAAEPSSWSVLDCMPMSEFVPGTSLLVAHRS